MASMKAAPIEKILILKLVPLLTLGVSAIFLSARTPAENRGERLGRVAAYESKPCGVKFRYPRNWEVSESPTNRNQGQCGFLIRPPDFSELKALNDVDVYTVTLEVFQADLKTAAEKGYFRRKENGGWIALGMFEMEEVARELRQGPKRVLSAAVTERCYHKDDGYAGLCELSVAVLNDGGYRSAALHAGPQAGGAFRTALNSHKFLPPLGPR